MDKKIIIIGFAIILFAARLTNAAGAYLYLSAPGDSFSKGEIFAVDVKMDTGASFINAASIKINFPADKLKIVSISKDASIFSLWPQEPVFSNDRGILEFSGGLPHPGFQGNNGQVLKIQFEAKEEGRVRLFFEDSQILANDGKGTDIFSKGFEEIYAIKPAVPQISSATHPGQTQWYKENDIEIHWNLEQDIIKVSFILDKDPQAWPDEIPEGRLDSYTYKDTKDGIWFFHLRVNTDKGWSNPRHFQVLIDKTPPLPFEIIVDNNGDPTNPRPVLYFEAHDQVSGIDHYIVRIGEGQDAFKETLPHNPYQMPLQKPGVTPVLVQAFDKAQNSRDGSVKVDIKPIERPSFTTWPRKFVSGVETFYLSGTSLPNVEVVIFLDKKDRILREWQVRANEQGEWSFTSNEILKSGFYTISAMARDERGAVSKLSDEQTFEVNFSGIEFGFVMITFGGLSAFLFAALAFGIIFIGVSIYRDHQLQKSLRREAMEVRVGLYQSFNDLKKEIERKVEALDSRPGFSEQEKKLCEDLSVALKTAKESIDKEISDVVNQLK